jgi:hypothetical protein
MASCVGYCPLIRAKCDYSLGCKSDGSVNCNYEGTDCPNLDEFKVKVKDENM